MAQVLTVIGNRPVFLSVDLDVLDPSEFPGTGTPEAGGVSFRVLDSLVRMLKAVRVVGADLVELCPPHDPSGISSAAASKLARTILLTL
jgi:agmatinase